MDPIIHAEISAKRWGGRPEEYLEIHKFFDSSKMVESSNRHRCYFHTSWSIKNIIVPIFGSYFIHSVGRKVIIQQLAENDHILADYKMRFIPTLGDFASCVEDDPADQDYIDTFHDENKQFFDENPEIRRLMVSPLAATGKLSSLLLTHNAYFALEILPRIFKTKIELKNYNISPARFFNRMKFQGWMDNGRGTPPSFKMLTK